MTETIIQKILVDYDIMLLRKLLIRQSLVICNQPFYLRPVFSTVSLLIYRFE